MTTEQKKAFAQALPEGCSLNQYRIGKAVAANGESTVYEAVRTEDDQSVWIREFLPQRMVLRNEESLDLVPMEEYQTMYKYSMAAFEELFQQLKNAKELEYILPVEEIFYAHNTVYVVKQALKLPTLQEEMARKGEPYSWTEAKKRLLPLMNSIAQLHGKGIVHLGIAPQHLYVTEDGHTLLSGFSTVEARIADGELDQERCSGFAAPEQYESGDWKGGICSDVYALGAVLYAMLTGEVPQDAKLRLENDELLPAMEKNSAIPENVSDAISGALMLDESLRSASVDDFASALLESVSGNTTIYDVPDSFPNEYTVHLEQEVQKPKKTLRKALLGMITFVLVTMGIAFLAYALVTERIFENQQQEENSENIEETVMVPVPDFVGHKYDDIVNNPLYYTQLNLNAVREYDNSYPEGVIIEQSVEKNTQVPQFTTVVLTVSLGKETVEMPNLIGWTLEGAKQQLNAAGIQYTVYVVENSNYTANTVFRTDPSRGTEIAASDGTVVKIYVTPEQQEAEKEKDNKKDRNNRD